MGSIPVPTKSVDLSLQKLYVDAILSEYSESDNPSKDDIERVHAEVEAIRSGGDEKWTPPQPSTDSTVWRYMNFTELMSVLERGSLWFSDIHQFSDPYEGTVPRSNIEDEIKQLAEQADIDPEIARTIHERLISGNRSGSGRYVNCWNISEYESAALWEQYIDSSEGIAICTTVHNLHQAFSDNNIELTFGEIEYIDYERSTIPSGRLPPLYHKRQSFAHENEYRVSFVDSENHTGPGVYVDVDIDHLMDEIYLAPTSKDWFYDQVKRVLDTYNADCKLTQSDIYSDPVY